MKEADRKGSEQRKLRKDYQNLKETRKYVEKREGLLKKFLRKIATDEAY